MNKRIYIDAGHGENVHGQADPGAVGPSGLTESAVTLDLANRLGHLLRALGHTTLGAVLGAQRDTENLHEAITAANAAGADLFVSLHCNSAVNRAAHGVEIWHGASAASRRCAALVLRSILDEIPGGGSQWLQDPVPLTSRGIKLGEFAVLTRTRMPAILVESVFISNLREERLLRDQNFLQAQAQAVANGIDVYCNGR